MLQLPTELIQLILLHCETPDFFQAARACRRLHDIVHSSREVILHRLFHTPGWFSDDLNALTTRQLYITLKCRSNTQLDGVEYQADLTTYGFPKVLDNRASAFESTRESNRALLVFKNDSTVYLVKFKDGKLIREAKWRSPGQDTGEVEIIQTAFDGLHGIYVLHRHKPFPDQELDPHHPFVQQAVESATNGGIYLAYHDLDTEETTVRMSAFPDHQGYTPLALSVMGKKFAISWQNTQDSEDHPVVLYELDDNESDDESEDEDTEMQQDGKITYASYRSYDLGRTKIGPAVRLTFNDRGYQLLCHCRGQTLHGSYRVLWDIYRRGSDRPYLANRCNVTFQYTPSLILPFSIGIPFFATHERGDVANGISCHWQYLAFGTATHRVENWTVACLLRSEAFPRRRCTHVLNLDRGRRFDTWKVMAQLGEFEQSTTSQGSQVAASRCGTRIAVANWKTLYVWALNPVELLDTESTFYPPSWMSSSDTPVLRPVILQLGAVCSQLRFTEKESELIAITDRGVMHINLNSSGPGKRNSLPGQEIICSEKQD
ncbi:unnamed protein product [Penicillium salamii]|nr:unnamed protein product [Penicillium salamii]CAG8387765.1 unnamed protein product [Penicillium salamii]